MAAKYANTAFKAAIISWSVTIFGTAIFPKYEKYPLQPKNEVKIKELKY